MLKISIFTFSLYLVLKSLAPITLCLVFYNLITLDHSIEKQDATESSTCFWVYDTL